MKDVGASFLYVEQKALAGRMTNYEESLKEVLLLVKLVQHKMMFGNR